MHRRSTRCAASTAIATWAIVSLLAAAPARAGDVTWINDGGGSFSDEANWTPDLPFSSDVPDANDVAHFGLTTSSIGLPKTYTVSFDTDPTNQRLVVEDDRVTFDLNGHTYTATSPIAVVLATESGRQGRVAVMDGFLSTPFQADIEIGSVAGSSGTLQVLTGGLVLGSPEIFVGVNGGGTLSIFNGGDVIADTVILGKNAGSTGTATITGASSSLLTTGLAVGSSGTGTLNVLSGGKVESTIAAVSSLTASGTATVSDAGSKWIVSGRLRVGAEQRGTLSITGGGHVEDLGGLISAGNSANATEFGFAEVKDANSKWTHQRDLQIGYFDGSGTLRITGGGMVENIAPDAIVTVGELHGLGTVDVDGPNSSWINASNLKVGTHSSRDNVVNITGGGFVQNADAVLGEFFNDGDMDRGTVIVSDPGSQWNASSIVVGSGGQGTLEVLAGGRVEVGSFLEIGQVGFGEVLVDGPASALNVGGELAVGGNGPGNLTITGGGRVVSSSAKIPSGIGVGLVVVSGAGSLWMNSDGLIVGEGGHGVLNITAGGRVDNTFGSIGSVGAGGIGSGEVTVSGPGSQWVNSDALVVGHVGIATLSITDGGVVRSARFSSLGEIENAGTSSVTVDGANSQWIHTGTLDVGRRSPGTLTITAGARVESGGATIATFAGTNGSAVTVSGTSLAGVGSTWDIDGPLGIGGDADAQVNGGIGTLTIQSGGTVSVAQHTIVFAGDELRLEGGTLSSPDISIRSGGNFLWTSGTLHAGIFRESLVVPSGGILAPGNSVGSTEVFIDYSQLTGGVLQIEIGGVSQSQFDRVIVTGDAFLGGNLQLALLGNFFPTPASMLTIFDARAISGTFANVVSGQRLMTSDGLGSFLVNYGDSSPFDPTQIVLSAFLPTVGLPGDYNQNGTVDAADYTLWRDHLGQTFTLTGENPAAATPGLVDAEDYAFWKSHFGDTAGSGSGATAGLSSRASSTIPEPASLLLVVCTSLLISVARGTLVVRGSPFG